MKALLTLLIVLALPSAAWGQGGTYHVDPGGVGGACNDAHSTSQAASARTPWCTIARAVDAAPANGVALVRRASIDRVTLMDKHRSGLVTLRPYPGEAVTINHVDIRSTSLVRFERFVFPGGPDVEAGGQGIEFVASTFEEGLRIAAGAGPVLLEENTIRNAGGTGVTFSADASDAPIVGVTIRRNRFDGIGVDAIQAKNFRSLLIEGNEFSNVRRVDSSAHPDVLQTVFGGQSLVFRNNWLHDYDAQGVFIADGTVSDVLVENNVIGDTDTDYSPVRIADANGLVFVNNTVRGLARFSAQTRAAVLKNNIFELLDLDRSGGLTVSYEDYNLIQSGPRSGANDRAGSPGFVNENANDFELSAQSPALDAGTSTGAPTLDMRGRTRVDDPSVANGPALIDMGALERGGGSPWAGGTPGSKRARTVTLRFPHRGRFLRAGRRIRITAICATACRVRAKALIARPLARRIGLLKPGSRRGHKRRAAYLLGRDSGSLQRPGRLTLRIRLSRRELKALRRARRPQVLLRVLAVDASGGVRRVRRTLILRNRR